MTPIRSHKTHAMIFLLLSSAIAPNLSLASDTTTEIERANLIAIARQIQQVDMLIDQAENAANPDARIRFDYGQLRKELLQVRQGIDRHLRLPQRTPRAVEPLNGDYTN